MHAWRSERYGGMSAERSDDDNKAWFEAMNGMTPGTNGISLDDIKKVEKIFMACLADN